MIKGGSITVAGGGNAPGIGSGTGDPNSVYDSSCGDITVLDTVTYIYVQNSGDANYCIGPGLNGSTCGTVSVPGYSDYITTSPYIYPAP